MGRYIHISENLAVNGTFNTDLTNWAGTNWAWESDGGGGGRARHTAGSNTGIVATLPIPTAGKTYEFTFTIGGMTSGSAGATIGGSASGQRSSNGTYTEILTAINSATPRISPVSGFDGFVDNIEIYEVQYVTGSPLDTTVRLKMC